MGSWEYLAEAKSLLINRIEDRLLLNEQFIDENVLIFKRDGTGGDFYAFANELTIPDYNIPKYLNTLKCKQLSIKEIRLLSGNVIQVYQARSNDDWRDFIGRRVGQIDPGFNNLELLDGNYMSADKAITIYIINNEISVIRKNRIRYLNSGSTFEIEDGVEIWDDRSFKRNLNKRITINGIPVTYQRVVDGDSAIYEIQESVIRNILFPASVELVDGSTIIIEQQDYSKITSGDRIVDAKPLFPMPDGAYKLKGKLFKRIQIRNSIIV